MTHLLLTNSPSGGSPEGIDVGAGGHATFAVVALTYRTALRSHYVLMHEGDGQLHTLTVLEQLREALKSLWGASSAAYFRVDELLRQLANPNLDDIPRDLPFRVEMWDQTDQHIRWVIAASASVAVGHAAMDAAIANYPDQRFMLRNGIQVIRQYPRA